MSAEQFTEARLADPALLDLVSRTIVVEDSRLTEGYPQGIPNRVTVTLDGNSIYRGCGRTLLSGSLAGTVEYRVPPALPTGWG